MFSRVKKFRDKIFSSSNGNSRKDLSDASEDGAPLSPTSRTASYSSTLPHSPSLHSPAASGNALRSPSRDFFKRKDSLSQRHSAEEAIAADLIALRHNSSISTRRSSNLGDNPMGSKDALPAVQVNTSLVSNRESREKVHPAQVPAPVGMASGQMLSPSGSGRRKSTPAALDFALRSAEGKHAVEDLLNHHNKKLVFGQYFAGNTAQHLVQPSPVPLSPGSSAAAKAAAVSRFNKASNLGHSGGSSSNSSGQQPALGGGSSRYMLAAAPPPIHEEDAPRRVQGTPSASPTSPDAHRAAMKSSQPVQEPSAGRGMVASLVPTNPHAAAATSSSLSAPLAPLQQTSPANPGGTSLCPPTAVARPGASLPPSGQPARALSGRAAAKVIVVSPTLPASMNRKVWAMSDYNIVRKMYTGYASTVYQALCKRSLEMVALKVYHLENLCELNHYQVYREIRVHAALQHQNIVHLFCAFQESSDVVLVQEYAEGGDLYRLLHKNGGRLHERQTVEMVLHPFLLALHYLHTNGIMHRDIKPENVLFTAERVLKLADFGLAIDLNEERAVTRAGTLDYMAPEVLRCPPKNLPQENKNNPYLHYNNSVDAWAVGVFAYELVVGFPPFAGETQLDSVDKIMHSTPDFPEKITELAKDFICQALRKHPGDRPTVMEMLHHPWIRSYQRRTSVRIPTARRRSSVSVSMATPMHEGAAEGEDGPDEATASMAPPQAAVAAAVAMASASSQQPSSAAQQAMDGGLNSPVDIADMTPEQIEEMIRKLQAAKVSAIARSSTASPKPAQSH